MNEHGKVLVDNWLNDAAVKGRFTVENLYGQLMAHYGVKDRAGFVIGRKQLSAYLASLGHAPKLSGGRYWVRIRT